MSKRKLFSDCRHIPSGLKDLDKTTSYVSDLSVPRAEFVAKLKRVGEFVKPATTVNSNAGIKELTGTNTHMKF